MGIQKTTQILMSVSLISLLTACGEHQFENQNSSPKNQNPIDEMKSNVGQKPESEHISPIDKTNSNEEQKSESEHISPIDKINSNGEQKSDSKQTNPIEITVLIPGDIFSESDEINFTIIKGEKEERHKRPGKKARNSIVILSHILGYDDEFILSVSGKHTDGCNSAGGNASAVVLNPKLTIAISIEDIIITEIECSPLPRTLPDTNASEVSIYVHEDSIRNDADVTITISKDTEEEIYTMSGQDIKDGGSLFSDLLQDNDEFLISIVATDLEDCIIVSAESVSRVERGHANIEFEDFSKAEMGCYLH